MTWNPGPMKFWDGVYEHPKEFFDPNDEARIQAQYFLAHPEIQALASLLIAHIVRKKVIDKNVLRDAAYFLTRPASVLQAEVDEFLKITNKFGLKDEMRKKNRVSPLPRPESVPDCACPSLRTPSIESVYSSFISKSSSVSTLPTLGKEEKVALSLDEAIWQLVSRALNNALNNMYAAREHDLFYDEAYLCLMTSVQRAVESVWGPRVNEINDIIDSLLDDVRRITSENRKLKILMTDKLPIKVNRLRNQFKGYAEKEDYPELKKSEILQTLKIRQGTYNRYAKDMFGVYLPTYDKSLDISTTYVPPACEKLDYSSSYSTSTYSSSSYYSSRSYKSTMDELPMDDLDEN